jgi:Na+:H+ antiporter, NhaA family
MRQSNLREFLTSEATGGLILIFAAIAALIIANSGLAPTYFNTLQFHFVGLSILHWINDGLMALFFLLVGLEIKREMFEGQLATWHLRSLPCIAALGGMIVPALIYLAFNKNSPTTINGWAVPVATDIAFALGVIAIAGKNVPASLKVFLTALAIIDDLGAIIIIALFYTSNLAMLYLASAAAILALLITLNRMKIQHLIPYLGLGCLLWYFTLKSGIHPSIAGVSLALTIPLKNLSEKLEHSLQPYVAFIIIPIFGFANSGLSLSGIQPSALLNSVPLGIALGLFFGKQIGIFGFSYAVVKLKIAHRPAHCTWIQFYGVSLICGIGFTMSLFIGNLAFASPALQDSTKLGVLIGSILSAVLGWLVLRFTRKSV